MPDRHVEWLYQANAADYFERRGWFYPFKTRFLRAHAIPDGLDLQTIVKKCWCGDGIWRGAEYTVPERYWERCHKCGGTGIYLTKHIVLIRWMLRDRLFHEPSSLIVHSSQHDYRVQFDGLIKHADVPSKTGRRAMQRLMLRYAPEMFIALWKQRATEWIYWRRVHMRSGFQRLNQALRAKAGLQTDDVPF